MSNKFDQSKKPHNSHTRKTTSDGMKSHLRDDTNDPKVNVKSYDLCWYGGVILSGLISLTLFLSGDLNERSGVVHFPAILWLVFAVCLTAAPIFFKCNIPKLVFSRFDILVYLFFFYVILSAVWNLFNGGAPRPTLNMISVWVLCASAWFVFRQLLHDVRVVAIIFVVVVAVAVTESGIAIYQQFVEIPKIKQLTQEDPIKFVKMADPTIEPNTPAWDMVYSRLVTALPVGTYPLSNTLGGFLGFCLIFILGVYSLGQTSRAAVASPIKIFNYRREIMFGILALVLLFGFILTKSRSGMVAVGLGFILLGLLSIRQRISKSVKRFLFIVTIILIVGIAAISMTSGKDLINGAKKSFGFRLEYWSATMGMIYDYPIFGCGTGNFKHTYTHYKLPISSEEISDPHNFIFELASNCGLPSVLIFIFAVGLICFKILGKPADFMDKIVTDNSNQSQPPPSQTQQSQQSFFILPYLIGGLFGCYFAFFLLLYSESPLGIDSLVLVTFVFLLFGLVDIYRFERVPSVVVLVSVIVLFVHISASSGISMTNTAILIWLFLSILANRQTRLEVFRLQSLLRYLISVTLIIFVLFINFFGFRPVIDSGEILYSLEFEGDVGRQVSVLLEAAKADPYSPFIQEKLARTAILCHLRDPDNKKWLEIADSAQAKVMQLAPRSGMLRYSCAEMRAEAGRRLKDVKLAESSIDIYREAVKYYPNSIVIRSAWAVILYQLGKKTEAGTQAEIAIKLDDQMKHIELKIKPDKREALLKYIEEAKKTTFDQ